VPSGWRAIARLSLDLFPDARLVYVLHHALRQLSGMHAKNDSGLAHTIKPSGHVKQVFADYGHAIVPKRGRTSRVIVSAGSL